MPSAEALRDQGIAAVTAGRYKEGIEKLSEALEKVPAPKWMLERSKAYLRTSEFDLALHDAETVLDVALNKRHDRDLMAEAHIRRSIAYYRMGRYADADICAFWAIRICEKALSSEQDGQDKKVDSKGLYQVTLQEVKDQNQPSTKEAGLAAAMGGGRGKDVSMKNQAYTWRIQALTAMEKLPADSPGRKVDVVKYPKPGAAPVKITAEDLAEADAEDGNANTPASSWEPFWKAFTETYAKDAVQFDFFPKGETDLEVTFYIRGKEVTQDNFSVKANGRNLVLGPISPLPSKSIRLHLFDDIKTSEITYRIVPKIKIVLNLKSERPGKWPKLLADEVNLAANVIPKTQGIKPIGIDQFTTAMKSHGITSPPALDFGDSGSADADTARAAWYTNILTKLDSGELTIAANAQSSAAPAAPAPAKAPESKPVASSSVPAYPTSSKKGPQNWDNLKDEGEEDEEKSGDVNNFFQQIFKNADPDTQRAMMKSYVQSNGTALSTSWEEAKDKEYETLPPDGAEARKWDK